MKKKSSSLLNASNTCSILFFNSTSFLASPCKRFKYLSTGALVFEEETDEKALNPGIALAIDEDELKKLGVPFAKALLFVLMVTLMVEVEPLFDGFIDVELDPDPAPEWDSGLELEPVLGEGSKFAELIPGNPPVIAEGAIGSISKLLYWLETRILRLLKL